MQSCSLSRIQFFKIRALHHKSKSFAYFTHWVKQIWLKVWKWPSIAKNRNWQGQFLTSLCLIQQTCRDNANVDEEIIFFDHLLVWAVDSKRQCGNGGKGWFLSRNGRGANFVQQLSGRLLLYEHVFDLCPDFYVPT